MLTIITDLMSAARRQALYHRTRAALDQMPLDVRLDLDIDAADFSRMAHKAVWG